MLRRENISGAVRFRESESFLHALGNPHIARSLHWEPSGAVTELEAEGWVSQLLPLNIVSITAIDLWLPRLDGAVVAIGNAPTALFRLLEVVAETGVRPAAVIGVPVGFVGAAESKEALATNDLGLDYLVVHGRRGGSAITCGALNAIASEVE